MLVSCFILYTVAVLLLLVVHQCFQTNIYLSAMNSIDDFDTSIIFNETKLQRKKMLKRLKDCFHQIKHNLETESNYPPNTAWESVKCLQNTRLISIPLKIIGILGFRDYISYISKKEFIYQSPYINQSYCPVFTTSNKVNQYQS